MKKGKQLMMKFGPMLAALALMVTTVSVNTTCTWVCYQDKLPESANKLRKF